MYCRNCGRKLEDGETVCPVCGPEADKQSATQPEKLPVNRKKLALVIGYAVLALAVVAAIIWAVARPTGDNETEPSTDSTQSADGTEETSGEPTAEELEAHPALVRESYTLDGSNTDAYTTVAVTAGEKGTTNGEFSIWYWQTYYDLLNNMGYYISLYGLDTSKPLSEQVCYLSEVKMNWEQFMVEQTIINWHSYQALALEAEKQGITITQQEQEELDALATEMETTAAQYGYESAQAMLEGDYGKGVTMEDYKNFVYLLMLGNRYYTAQQEGFLPTEDEVSAHYDANAEDYAANGVNKDGTPATINVRHILIQPEGDPAGEDGSYSDEQIAAARAQAQVLLADWMAGDATEESFGTLANENSADGGSNTNGGLYEDVAPGDMVDTFNDWCFDASRQYGDTGLVETTYGVHIMFFVSASEEAYWFSTASADLLSQRLQDMVDETMERYPVTVDYEKLGISELAQESDQTVTE